ncbi:hypothetical protein QQF64_007659 [Cirrhinus molitorella]|uniref:Uncharacterized protein n=1 Tax=Cirrhinus molitorella TaxID=172907 RepID=A0ABR3MEJ0_9TELE
MCLSFIIWRSSLTYTKQIQRVPVLLDLPYRVLCHRWISDRVNTHTASSNILRLKTGMFSDALDAVGQVEGLTLSPPQTLPDPDDEVELGTETKRRGRYRHSLQILKPFRITHK